MTNPLVMELIMQDRQRQVAQAAARDWQRDRFPKPRRAPLRTGAGWVLLRAGARLADLDPSVLAPAHPLS
ncbi:MAG: hypothetical protein ACRDZ8_07475 [Acidimicrobiales bacterium]